MAIKTILNHLTSPLTYSVAGKTKELSSYEIARAKTATLVAAAFTVLGCLASSRPLKSSLGFIGTAALVTFYLTTGFLKWRIPQPPPKPPPRPQSQPPVPPQPVWLQEEPYEGSDLKAERAYFISLWKSIYGTPQDKVSHQKHAQRDEQLKTGVLKILPSKPWATFAKEAQQRLLSS